MYAVERDSRLAMEFRPSKSFGQKFFVEFMRRKRTTKMMPSNCTRILLRQAAGIDAQSTTGRSEYGNSCESDKWQSHDRNWILFPPQIPMHFDFFLFFCVSDSSCERLYQMPIDKKSNFSSNFTAFITLECMCKYHSSGGLHLPKMVTFIGRILYSFEFRTNSLEYVRLSSIRRIQIFFSPFSPTFLSSFFHRVVTIVIAPVTLINSFPFHFLASDLRTPIVFLSVEYISE